MSSSTFFRRGLLSAVILAAASGAPAQPSLDAADFPAAAMRFLDAEMPAMEAAVAARDSGFFEGAVARSVEFADAWGFKAGSNRALARYQPCVGAVSEHLVVGLCRLSPGSDECTPHLASGFAQDLQACRALAGR
ncbi:MAG: hypothetical protein QM586_11760 [Xenophilus sp.]